MNANELADHMEKYFDSEPYCDEVVTMLRQQQAEIAALRRHRAWIEETAVKEQLTDEEICKIFNEHTGLGIHQKEADKADLLVFARAILRKVQENG
jgi:hypothetical protein